VLEHFGPIDDSVLEPVVELVIEPVVDSGFDPFSVESVFDFTPFHNSDVGSFGISGALVFGSAPDVAETSEEVFVFLA
jgi:hypothetical protein